MSKFNKDILFLIAEELQDDIKSLYSCLLVNKTWCETTVLILWKNPGLNNAHCSLYNVILSHLSEESRDDLKNQGIDLFTSEAYQQPLFNYISFWKHLDLTFLHNMIMAVIRNLKNQESESIISNEIFKMFISRNARFTFILVSRNISDNFMERFAKISKSIKKLELWIDQENLRAVVKLIEAQENLNDINIYSWDWSKDAHDYKILEESLLIKHAGTVQHLKINWCPLTKILSYLVNLLSLDIDINSESPRNSSHLENMSLPSIKFLKVRGSTLSKFLTSVIKNAKGNLTEINIRTTGDYELDKMVIQAIREYCPNLRYLKLYVSKSNILDFKDLLINCQYLNGLYICLERDNDKHYYDNIFEILAKFSPTSLLSLNSI